MLLAFDGHFLVPPKSRQSLTMSNSCFLCDNLGYIKACIWGEENPPPKVAHMAGPTHACCTMSWLLFCCSCVVVS